MEGKSIIGQIGVVFGTLLAIAVILYLAYAATKLLGKRFSVRGGGSKKIKILMTSATTSLSCSVASQPI